MMRNSNATQRASWTVGDVCRRMLLSWLTAVLVQYLCLSPGNRSLEGLEGLAATGPDGGCIWAAVLPGLAV